MKWIIGLGAGCATTIAALALTSSPVRAQSPPMVTITFKLTINGTPAAHDSFGVERQVELCTAPCFGGGHTYTASIPWLKGSSPVQFVFARFIFAGNGTPVPDQKFGQQTVDPNVNRTVSATFTYRASAATVTTPNTGGAVPFALDACLMGSGSAMTILALLHRRRGRRLERGSQPTS